MGEWLFRELFPLKAQQIDLLYRKLSFANEALEIAKDNNAKYDRQLAHALMERNIANDRWAASELELSTLRNKIVERAQVPSTLKAKTSADVRRIVEQANEAEFEEQANGFR